MKRYKTSKYSQGNDDCPMNWKPKTDNSSVSLPPIKTTSQSKRAVPDTKRSLLTKALNDNNSSKSPKQSTLADSKNPFVSFSKLNVVVGSHANRSAKEKTADQSETSLPASNAPSSIQGSEIGQVYGHRRGGKMSSGCTETVCKELSSGTLCSKDNPVPIQKDPKKGGLKGCKDDSHMSRIVGPGAIPVPDQSQSITNYPKIKIKPSVTRTASGVNEGKMSGSGSFTSCSRQKFLNMGVGPSPVPPKSRIRSKSVSTYALKAEVYSRQLSHRERKSTITTLPRPWFALGEELRYREEERRRNQAEWDKWNKILKARRGTAGQIPLLAPRLSKASKSAPPLNVFAITTPSKMFATSIAPKTLRCSEPQSVTTSSKRQSVANSSNRQSLVPAGDTPPPRHVCKGWGLARWHLMKSKARVPDETSSSIQNGKNDSKTPVPFHVRTTNNEVLKVVRRILILNRKMKCIHRWQRAIRLVRTIFRIAQILAWRSYEDEVKAKTFLDIAGKYANLERSSSHRVIKLAFHRDRPDAHGLAMTRETRKIMMAPPETRTTADIRRALPELQNINAFCTIPLTTQQLLVAHGSYEYICAKRVIIRRGHVAKRYYLILSGIAQATKLKNTKSGVDRCTHAILSQGSGFGHEAILESRPHQYSIISHEPLHLISITAEHLFETIKRDAEMPPHIRFLMEQEWMKSWPIHELKHHPTQSFMFYAKDRQVVVMDSTKDDYLYVVKSGTCVVMTKIIPGTEKLIEEEPTVGYVFPSRLDYYKDNSCTLNPRHSKASEAKLTELCTKGNSSKILQEFRSDESQTSVQRPLKDLSNMISNPCNCIPGDVKDDFWTGPLGRGLVLEEKQSLPHCRRSSRLRFNLRNGRQRNWQFREEKLKKHKLRKHKTVWDKRKAYRIPKRCLPVPRCTPSASAPSTVATLPSADHTASRDVGKAAVQPVFYAVRTLYAGHVFGFDQLHLPLLHEVQPKADSFSLVSCGAEIVALEKVFFLHHADNKTEQSVMNYILANQLPTHHQIYEMDTHFRETEKDLKKMSDQVLKDITNRKKYNGLYFQTETANLTDFLREIKYRR